MTSHALCSWHHSHYIWNGIHRFWVITTTPLMVSDQLYVWHNTHHTYAILCTLHSIYPLFMFSHHCSYHITSTAFMTSHPLYMTSHTRYLWRHSHSNYDKTPTMFVTLNSVYKTSHMLNEWQQNECIWHDNQCICVIKPTWLMTSQPMYKWNHTHCMYDRLGTLHANTSTLIFSFFFICRGFCHTFKWNNHGFTCVPHSNPSSHLPLHPFTLCFPSAPVPSACLMHPTWAGDLFHPR